MLAALATGIVTARGRCPGGNFLLPGFDSRFNRLDLVRERLDRFVGYREDAALVVELPASLLGLLPRVAQ